MTFVVNISLAKSVNWNFSAMSKDSRVRVVTTTTFPPFLAVRLTCGVPPAGDGLVSMSGDHHTGEGPGEVALEVGEDEVVVVAGGEEIVGAGGEPDAPHVTGVDLELLDRPPASDVMEDHAGVLVTRHQQPPGGVDAARGHGGPRGGLVGEGDHVHTAPGPEVPEPDRLVLRAGDEHGPAPGVEGEDVSGVSGHGLEGSDGVAVRDVDLAVPGPGRQEERAAPAPALLHEAAVPHRPVVHAQVVLAPLQ